VLFIEQQWKLVKKTGTSFNTSKIIFTSSDGNTAASPTHSRCHEIAIQIFRHRIFFNLENSAHIIWWYEGALRGVGDLGRGGGGKGDQL
jgi:hypothetical protein